MKRRIALLALVAATSFASETSIKVERAWARPTVAGQPGGGGFLTLTSVQGDRLLGGSTPAAERVELHTMNMDGDIMRMRQIDAIELPPGRTVKLEPGGMHLMLMGLKAPLKAGDKLALTLRFERAGELRIDVPISAKAPSGPT